MARILVVSRNAAMAMGLSSTDHDVVDLRPAAFQDWMARADRNLDALVLDLDEPDVALNAVTQLRSVAMLAPALLVSSNRPGWDSDELRHLPAAQVLPLPISRPALLAALEDLLSGQDFDVAADLPPFSPFEQFQPAHSQEPAPMPDSEPVPHDVQPGPFNDTEPPPVPEPEPIPGPTPEPVPGPTPEPIPMPEPEPLPGPGPEPVPGPEPEPVPEPERIAAVEPVRQPEPATASADVSVAASLPHLHTAEALEQLLSEESGDLNPDEAVPVHAPHDYQRELGLHAPPQPSVSQSPAPAAPARATPSPPKPPSPAKPAEVSRGPSFPARLRPPRRERPEQPEQPEKSRPEPPSERRTAQPAQKRQPAHARRPARPASEPRRAKPAAPEPQPARPTPEPHHPTAVERVDPVLLVRRLIEHAEELYGVPETAEVVIADAVERTNAEAGALLIPDDGHWRVAAGVNLRPLEHRFQLRADSWLVLEIARGNKGAIIEESDIARQPLQGAPLAWWRHLLVAPVPHIDGILLLARSEAPFDEGDLTRLADLGNEAGPLLANSMEVRRLARELDQYRDEPGR